MNRSKPNYAVVNGRRATAREPKARLLIPIVLFTSQQILWQLLGQHLARTRKFQLTGLARTGAEAVRMCQTLQPVILAIDQLGTEPDVRWVLKQLRDKAPQTRVVQFNAAFDQTGIQTALKQGVIGYAGRDASVAELLRIFEAANAGRLAVG